MASWLPIASVFTGAFLLFAVQPMIAKLLLPRFGGSPGVWNTCLVLFQGLLLLGYAYARFAPDRLGARHRVAHAFVLAIPLAFLPIALRGSAAAGSGGDAWPIPALILAVLLAVGPLFFVLSTHSTLAQRWVAERTGRDPTALYAASNAGSLLALLGYPLVVEPFVGLGVQRVALSAGYVVFVGLAGWLMWSTRTDGLQASGFKLQKGRISGRLSSDAFRWVLLSGTASLLLCAVSSRIATDVASAPLLWVVPLALYLLTFILAFLPSAPYPRRALVFVSMIGIGIALVTIPARMLPLWLLLPACLGTLFAGGWICHRDLAEVRPAPERLGEYFLWISVGGFLGGAISNLLAPLVFDDVAEFPLALALLAWTMLARDFRPTVEALRPPRTWLAGGAMAFLLVVAWVRWPERGDDLHAMAPGALVMAGGLALFRMRGQFAIAASVLALATAGGLVEGFRVLDRDRSFFGVMRVVQEGSLRMLMHGTTLHGAQIRVPLVTAPVAYYHSASPIARALAAAPDDADIGVVGLGAGSVAALVREGQRLTFYEIDPEVEPLARFWFSYLDGARAPVETILGDARLTLARETDRRFDLLFVDAFSSDAIPVHLLTDEALALYLERVETGGVVLLHVSNRHLDLRPIVRASAEKNGWAARWNAWDPTDEEAGHGALTTVVVAFARDPVPLAAMTAEAGWKGMDDGIGPARMWTDDHSSILPLFGLPR